MAETVEYSVQHTTVRGTAKEVAELVKKLGLNGAGGGTSQVIDMPNKDEEPKRTRRGKDEEPEDKPKRGRGRGKDKDEEPEDEPKRGRGRGRGKDKDKDKDEDEDPPKRGRGRGKDKDEDEDPPKRGRGKDKDDEDGDLPEGVDPEHEDLQGARRLRDILVYLQDECGIEDVEEMVKVCKQIKDDVPLLRRVNDVEERVTAAHDLMMEQAS